MRVINQELIDKYYREWKHYSNGGWLLFKYSNNTNNVICWVREDGIISDGLWFSRTSDIKHVIIDDDYVLYRKVITEGYTIQARIDDNSEYEDLILPVLFNLPIENYRIKSFDL